MGEHYNALPFVFIRVSEMARLAVDIVLLPEEAMSDFAVSANAELVQNFVSEIVLDSRKCLPHISLAMGCINDGDILQIGELLLPMVEFIPKKLKPVGIQRTINSSGKIVSVIQVQRTAKLQKLHEKVCRTLKPYFSYDVAEEMMEGGQAGTTVLQWIMSYPDKASYANFSPHITIGYGDLTDRPLPRDFAVSLMALCHLGNHCTCRKILWSAEI
jgi:hypothetical protein